jgi:hypothetical protein
MRDRDVSQRRIKIVIENDPGPLSPREAGRLRGIVRRLMETEGQCGPSVSGKSLVFAVEWCEDTKTPFIILGSPGIGYTLAIAGKEHFTFKDLKDNITPGRRK